MCLARLGKGFDYPIWGSPILRMYARTHKLFGSLNGLYVLGFVICPILYFNTVFEFDLIFSWGVHYGERGYIKMARNRLNQCGIALYACYPTM